MSEKGLRAGKACHRCRVRKVRCDVEKCGIPCRNCIYGKTDCFIDRSRRGRKPRKPLSHGLESKQATVLPGKKSIPEAIVFSPTKVPVNSEYRSHTAGWLPQEDMMFLPPVKIGVASRSQVDPATQNFQATSTSIDASNLHKELSYAGLLGGQIATPIVGAEVEESSPSNTGDRSLLSTSTSIDASNLHKELSYADLLGGNIATPIVGAEAEEPSPSNMGNQSLWSALPAFIKPLPNYLEPCDIDYLSSKGALTLPPAKLQEELINCYILYVHPFLPVVDLVELLRALYYPSAPQRSKISILLYQAIMFAGVSFIGSEKVKDLGFAAERDARKAYHDKTRILYDLDAEPDQLTIVQSVLLLTSYSQTPQDNKGTWHWMSVALSSALALGLHRNATDTIDSRRENRLRRRVWWCCYLRDRIIALAMSRAMRIRDDEFDTLRLTYEDFDTADIVIQGLQTDISPESFPVAGLDTLSTLAEMFMFMVDIGMHAGEVITLQYSLLPSETLEANNGHSIAASRTMLFPKAQPKTPVKVQAYDEKLQNLFRRRPKSCHYYSQRQSTSGSQHPTISVHRSFIHMTFHAVVSALHRPLVSLASPHSEYTPEQRLSLSRIFEAGVEISRACHDLRIHNLDYLLPPTIILIQIPAILSHIPRVRLHKACAAHSPLGAMLESLKVCETLQAAHPGVDVVMGFLTTVLKRAQIEMIRDDHGKILFLRSQSTESGMTCDVSPVTASKNGQLGNTALPAEASYHDTTCVDQYSTPPNLQMPPQAFDEVSSILYSAADFDSFMNLDDLQHLDTDWETMLEDLMTHRGPGVQLFT